MATVTSPKSATEESEGDQLVVMRDIGWNGYSAVLRARGDRKVPRMVYLDGDLYLLSPAFPHEHIGERLGYFVMVVVEELDIPCIPAGSTTFRRKRKKGGVEGDKTFYLANVPRIRGRQKEKLHLRKDPPPDLVVEAVNTHDADPSIEVWRRFKVPEVWVHENDLLQILVLQPDGKYEPSEVSASFPFLKAVEIQEWINRPHTDSETDWIKALRRWVAQTLIERYRKQQDEKV